MIFNRMTGGESEKIIIKGTRIVLDNIKINEKDVHIIINEGNTDTEGNIISFSIFAVKDESKFNGKLLQIFLTKKGVRLYVMDCEIQKDYLGRGKDICCGEVKYVSVDEALKRDDYYISTPFDEIKEK